MSMADGIAPSEVGALIEALRENAGISGTWGEWADTLQLAAADEIEKQRDKYIRATVDHMTQRGRALRAERAYEALSKAANTILAHVTAKVGRALYEAPDEDLVPLMATYGVELPAKLFRILYDAADPALIATSDDPLTTSPSGSGSQRRGGE